MQEQITLNEDILFSHNLNRRDDNVGRPKEEVKYCNETFHRYMFLIGYRADNHKRYKSAMFPQAIDTIFISNYLGTAECYAPSNKKENNVARVKKACSKFEICIYSSFLYIVSANKTHFKCRKLQSYNQQMALVSVYATTQQLV